MKPAVSLVAVAGRRRATLDLARRLEQDGSSLAPLVLVTIVLAVGCGVPSA